MGMTVCIPACIPGPMEATSDIRTIVAGVMGGCKATTWVLGTEPWSPARVASVFNLQPFLQYQDISPLKN